ncbi:MAG: nickel-dependent hydrogenase large subunit [Candidatus Njordarchaeota archaeon]
MAIDYSYLDLLRIGGDAEFIVKHDGEKILDAYFVSRAPIRGFEKIMIGKNPVFAVEISMRICGICHAAHGIAAVEAIEDAVGIMPPPNGIVLREIIGLVNRVQSHMIHLILITPDIVKREVAREFIIEEMKMLSVISDILTKLGGAPTHPPNIVIGGIQSIPKERHLQDVVNKIKMLRSEADNLINNILDDKNISETARILMETKYAPKYLASHLFYGERSNLDVNEIVTKRYDEFRTDNIPEDAKSTTSLVALYKDAEVEVGPRARLSLFGKFGDNTIFGIQRARMMEMLMGLDRINDLLGQIDLTEPSKTETFILRRGQGVGVFEAPRGLLVHYVEINSDGRIERHRIVVPTMFNIPIIEEASRGLPVSVADVIPRIYDPCIPCTTHMIRVK